MTARWIILLTGVGYLLFLVVFWTLLRAAGIADRAATRFTDRPGRPCPVCHETDVYVDSDDICFCITCRASYPLVNAGAVS